MTAPADLCARCGAPFRCGAESGHCWCAQLPALAHVPVDPSMRCLCPACLRALTGPAGAPENPRAR